MAGSIRVPAVFQFSQKLFQTKKIIQISILQKPEMPLALDLALDHQKSSKHGPHRQLLVVCRRNEGRPRRAEQGPSVRPNSRSQWRTSRPSEIQGSRIKGIFTSKTLVIFGFSLEKNGDGATPEINLWWIWRRKTSCRGVRMQLEDWLMGMSWTMHTTHKIMGFAN